MKVKNNLLIYLISILIFVTILTGSYFFFKNIGPNNKDLFNQPSLQAQNSDKGESPKSTKMLDKKPEKVKSDKPEPIKLVNTDPNKFQLDIPALTYHHIATLPDDLKNDSIATGLRVSPDAFDAQMKKLKDKGYTTLSIEEYERITVGDKPMPKNPILLTIDDGYTDAYENAFPILKKYGLIGNFAIITDVLSTREYMSLDNVITMQKAGMGIMSHTTLHCQLAQRERKNGQNIYLDNLTGNELKPCPEFTYPGGLTAGQADYELKESKEFLQKKLGIQIDSVVYPYGNYNPKTMELTKKNGYKFGFTTKGSVTPLKPDTILFELPRSTVGGQQTPELRGFFVGI
ncbi:MAG: polysaccharide deacetylase family protein [candidate division SR1 bacterium]|nr:polysaccharide deacetylase family protein [candidate division SR1 bacterium]